MNTTSKHGCKMVPMAAERRSLAGCLGEIFRWLLKSKGVSQVSQVSLEKPMEVVRGQWGALSFGRRFPGGELHLVSFDHVVACLQSSTVRFGVPCIRRCRDARSKAPEAR